MIMYIYLSIVAMRLTFGMDIHLCLYLVYASSKGHCRTSQYAVTHVHNKNSNIQGRSPNVVKVFSIPEGTALIGNNSLPCGANSFL